MREPPPKLLQQGRIDAAGLQIQTGLEVLLSGLRRRFGSLGIETSVKAIIDLITFKRGNENIDEALSRFETLRNQVQEAGEGFRLPIPVTAFLLLEALSIPRPVWPLILPCLQRRFSCI